MATTSSLEWEIRRGRTIEVRWDCTIEAPDAVVAVSPHHDRSTPPKESKTTAFAAGLTAQPTTSTLCALRAPKASSSPRISVVLHALRTRFHLGCPFPAARRHQHRWQHIACSRSLAGQKSDRLRLSSPARSCTNSDRHPLPIDNEEISLPPLYYGTVDATALWICLLHDTWRAGLPTTRCVHSYPSLEAALAWDAGLWRCRRGRPARVRRRVRSWSCQPGLERLR